MYTFTDGEKNYVLRVPKIMNDNVCTRMDAEAKTLVFVKSIGIPVPSLLEYDLSTNNPIKSAHMIQTQVDGTYSCFLFLVLSLQAVAC